MLKKRAARRLDWRKQDMSRPLKAIKRGPAWPVGTPAGKAPQVTVPQRQVRRWRWYSVTLGLISGNSQTWCRKGWGSVPLRGAAQRRQVGGTQGMTCWHCSVGSRGRWCLAWPGWPPERRGEFVVWRIGLAGGWYDEGGSEELGEVLA